MLEALKAEISTQCGQWTTSLSEAYGELTLETSIESIRPLMQSLINHKMFQFEQLIDICAVDYLMYGQAEWETDQATAQGFSRARQGNDITQQKNKGSSEAGRFHVVYHLMSVALNHRLRVVVPCEHTDLIPTVSDLWPCANWFEREAFDLYGIYFSDHPDLRRILTDYGFIGHPMRKDFPVSGHVEMRYDAKQGRVVYEPVQIEPRTLVSKVIRQDESSNLN